jgi:hypothetical protein
VDAGRQRGGKDLGLAAQADDPFVDPRQQG